MLCRLGRRVPRDSFEIGPLDLISLGQDEVIADRRVVEHGHHLMVNGLEAVARIDQHQRPLEHGPAAQIVVDQEPPALDEILRRLGESVARHVDQPHPQRLANVEEIELLGAPGSI
jgi:hypothetical protein